MAAGAASLVTLESRDTSCRIALGVYALVADPGAALV
jgi:hypothetical protein